jgi:hypothetical protein
VEVDERSHLSGSEFRIPAGTLEFPVRLMYRSYFFETQADRVPDAMIEA